MENSEKIFDNVSFLKPPVCEGREHFEVTRSSMEKIKEKYDWYSNDENGYNQPSKRRQRSMPGYCLSRGERDMSLDISADILTAISAFTPLKGTPAYEFFEKIYHSCGNIMPICEGGNLGGGTYKTGASSDFYSRKLLIIKDAFFKCTDESGDFKCMDKSGDFEAIIGTDPCKIGRNRKELIECWIKWEWPEKDQGWKKFIYENYLEDLAGNLNFETLHCKGENVDALKKVIWLVVRRGYRIEHKIHGDFSDRQEEDFRKIIKAIEENKDFSL